MYEYTVSDVGWTTSGDWLRVQQETLSEHGAEGWELVSVVLLETSTIQPTSDGRNLKPFLAHAVAMYFKRKVILSNGEADAGDNLPGQR